VIALRQNIKRFTPQPIWRAGRDSWLAIKHGLLWPSATFHPLRRKSIANLAALKEANRGQRAFILGNGPSLRKTDVSKLRNEFTFGMNRVYLAFDEWGFETSYLLSVNDLVIEQSAQEIAALKMPKFLSWRSRQFIQPDDHTTFLHSTYERPSFSKDVRTRVWEGATVTYVALQLAFHMGFEQVILIGVDHSFSSKGKANTTVVSQGEDKDHFAGNYFGAGFRWQLPDLDMSERAYQMARSAFEEDGRQVLDATIDGQLTVFPKINYDSLF
jgi:hypothetical protein